MSKAKIAKEQAEKKRQEFIKTLNAVADHNPDNSEGAIAQIFTEVHLGNGHDGLAKIAKRNNFDINSIRIGDIVVFLNRDLNAMKVFTAGNMYAYMKLPKGMVIDRAIIKLLPKFFNGHEIDYKAAMREHLIKKHPQLESIAVYAN